MWKGKVIISVKDYKKMTRKDFAKYKNISWEKEAYSNMEKLYKVFLNSDEWKSLQGKDDTLDYIMKEI